MHLRRETGNVYSIEGLPVSNPEGVPSAWAVTDLFEFQVLGPGWQMEKSERPYSLRIGRTGADWVHNSHIWREFIYVDVFSNFYAVTDGADNIEEAIADHLVWEMHEFGDRINLPSGLEYVTSALGTWGNSGRIIFSNGWNEEFQSGRVVGYIKPPNQFEWLAFGYNIIAPRPLITFIDHNPLYMNNVATGRANELLRSWRWLT